MNNRINIFLGAIFVLLLGAAVIPNLPEDLDLPFLSQTQSTETLLNLDVEQISKITLVQSEAEQIVIEKKDGQWHVNDKLASSRQVSRLLDGISNDEIESIASTNPDKFNSFLIKEDSAKILVQIGETESTVLLGKEGNQAQAYYAQRQGEETVLLVNGLLKDLIYNTEEDWRNKILATISADEIAQIEIAQTGLPLVLTRNESDQWQAIRGQQETTLGEITSDRLLETLDPIEASGFAEQDGQDLFNRTYSKETVTITTVEDKVYEINLIQDNNRWLGSISDNEEIFIFPASFATALVLDAGDIFGQ